MLPSEYDSQDCSIARALELVGERWTLLIVRSALMGRTAFDELQAELGIAPSTLTRRLDALVDNGLLTRRPDPDDGRRSRYELTERGRGLWLVIEALREWGDELSDVVEPPLRISHRSCDGDIALSVVCTSCGTPMDTRDLVADRHRPVRRSDS